MNIITEDNLTRIIPKLSSNTDISQESTDICENIARFNEINKKLNNNCSNCNCDNFDKTLSKCIPNGSLNKNIMFIDAFPTEYETFTGALTDEKGFLLNEALKNCKINRDDIYCTNIIKCYNIKCITEQHVRNCSSNYLSKEFKIVKPKKTIFTYSAFQAGLKYKIINHTGLINYFTKTNAVIYDIETELYIVYDINSLATPAQRQSFITGMQSIIK